jgi:hypothetical protein
MLSAINRPPILSCPTCSIVMVMKDRYPLLFGGKIDVAVYHCDLCGHEAKRDIRWDARWTD